MDGRRLSSFVLTSNEAQCGILEAFQAGLVICRTRDKGPPQRVRFSQPRLPPHPFHESLRSQLSLRTRSFDKHQSTPHTMSDATRSSGYIATSAQRAARSLIPSTFGQSSVNGGKPSYELLALIVAVVVLSLVLVTTAICLCRKKKAKKGGKGGGHA